MKKIIASSEHTDKIEKGISEIEHQLFRLDTFPILDLDKALTLLGHNKTLFNDLLSTIVREDIPQTKSALDTAYKHNNWKEIEYLAHKMKGGAIYVGAERMKMACQFVEQYIKSVDKIGLEALYRQMIQVMEQTHHTMSVFAHDSQS